MMEESTKIAIEENVARIGKSVFQAHEITGIDFKTFTKYVEIKIVGHEILKEVSIEELVNLLNKCKNILNGCVEKESYTYNWEYRIIDGKPYEVIKTYGYVLV